MIYIPDASLTYDKIESLLVLVNDLLAIHRRRWNREWVQVQCDHGHHRCCYWFIVIVQETQRELPVGVFDDLESLQVL